MNWLTRLAQIADELDQKGLSNDADRIDNAISTLSPVTDQPAPVVNNPMNEAQKDRLMDEFVDSIIATMKAEGVPLENPTGQSIAQNEMSKILMEASTETSVLA